MFETPQHLIIKLFCSIYVCDHTTTTKWCISNTILGKFLQTPTEVGSQQSWAADRVEGALPLWRWHGCKAPKTPLFSALLSPNDPIFLLIVYAVTQRPHIFWWNVGSLITLTQRPPIFCIRLPQEAIFVSISSTNRSFLSFSANFFCRFLLLKRSLKDQKQFPLILNQNLASHPMTSHFLRLCSHQMPSLWKCEPYIRIHLILECPGGVPPTPRAAEFISLLTRPKHCYQHLLPT